MLAKDEEIRDFIQQHLYVAALCDILDTLGYRNQAMHQRLRPLLPDMRNCGFVGRARTVRWMETDYIVESDPYGLEIDLMDDLRPGDVVVHSTDYSGTNAPWGELMSTVARRNGAVGCVCDSQIRDAVKIIAMGFPVYYAGIRPVDSQGRGRVMAYDVPIRCGEVLVNPGELVVADFDGIVVIPRAVEAQVLTLAQERVSKEDQARRDLLDGRSLREVYNKYGVL
ncbi:RraA family protein [Litorilinea aerophila]|uniref:Putative 4-hydroxy-4-methyl-2-oxoglutarate aldolase n=1 Tax=Litorilinea aerophila TaxID=1204385 RepID=A0A540VM37_9CHLR|nr:RraA family protein [Litorilinea aerophila]MCC9074984.1 RraA family protein [Litorilinea aerophila]OUC09509.1 demethylmenaquinone methyltransferase [Litorilinea aerophila]